MPAKRLIFGLPVHFSPYALLGPRILAGEVIALDHAHVAWWIERLTEEGAIHAE